MAKVTIQTEIRPFAAIPPLFEKTSSLLIARELGRCWLSGATAKTIGKPLEVCRLPVQREHAESWDWAAFAKDCQAGKWGQYAAAFDWVAFFVGAINGKPLDPYKFVDDMRVNGVLLDPKYISGDYGILSVPFPKLIAQNYKL